MKAVLNNQQVRSSNVDMWRTVSPWVKKAARKHGAALVGKGVLQEGEPDGPNDGPNPYGKWEITEAARTRLRKLVIKAIDNGWTVNQLQHEILQHEIIVNERFPAACALTIAWTESMYVYNYGKHQAAKESGMKYKSWIGSGDACEICLANIGQGRIPINSPFQSGVLFAPGHTRCRCGIGYSETKYGD